MSKRMLVLPQLWVYVFLASVISLPELNAAGTALAQGTAFTYQGKLADSGNPATGQYDFQLKLFDTATVGTGTQQGPTVTVSNVTVTAGIFTVQLDFGACVSCFDGSARFLEIAVKQTSGSTFVTLGPRQPVTSDPYAIRSLNSATADGLSVACIGCITSSQIASVNGSAVTGAIPVAGIPPGSGNYIQNTTSQQPSSNFNISGNGTAAGTLSGTTVNSATQFNIGGSRVLSKTGFFNLFAGVGAGAANTGADNAFFGSSAGEGNTTGFENAFFGSSAGAGNTAGVENAFFGSRAGEGNTTGSQNAFFGSSAGRIINGNANSFFGDGIGSTITTGSNNAFFGASAGNGASAFGRTISGNTLLGSLADSDDGLTNAAAIGFQAKVTASNSLVLGSIAGFNSATASTNVGIGTTAPLAKLDIGVTSAHLLLGDTGCAGGGAAGIGFGSSLTGCVDYSMRGDGTNTLINRPTGGFISFRENNSTQMFIAAGGNVGIGTIAPADKLHVAGDIRVGTGTTGCVKDADGTVIAGACSSDVRLKRSITPFPELLDKLVRLQPVHFYWRADEFPERHLGSSQSFGLVAQDVEKVMPDLVAEDESGYKMVRYNKLPLLLLEAIKELKVENDSLKQELHKVSQQQEQSRQQQIVIDGLKKMICLDHPNADLCK